MSSSCGVGQGVNQTLVAADGAAVMFECINKQFELIKIHCIGFVGLLLAAVEGGPGLAHGKEDITLSFKFVHDGLDLLE